MTSTTPSAFAALAAFPALQRQVDASIAAQRARVAERLEAFVPRPEVVAAVDASLKHAHGGIVALQGEPGAGVTSLLCFLAATRPWLLWLPNDDAGGGLEALCAQLLARGNLPVPLVPSAARRDAATLERLLAEAAANTTEPIVVLIDQFPAADCVALPQPFPLVIPDGVVIVHACGEDALPLRPAARVTLPTGGAAAHLQLIEAARRYGAPPEYAEHIATLANGLFLYARCAASLLHTGLLGPQQLAPGLSELHRAWWRALDPGGQQLALTLAAAGEALPLMLAAEASGLLPDDVQQEVARWGALLEVTDGLIAFRHTVTRQFVAAQSEDGFATVHHAFVALALERTGGRFERLDPVADSYLVRQLARHLAWSSAAVRSNTPPLLSRSWILAQERRTGSMRAAADDAAWLLRAAGRDNVVELARAAALAGTLGTLARTLPLQGLAEAVATALARGGGREATLHRAQALVDQLPDGRDKALALRRLGEVCHEYGMRAPAMRMLASALDLEVPGLPRTWRDEREETLVAFARAAIAAGAPDFALGITTRITHPERRGMIETEVVRAMLALGTLTRAEEVAYAIAHENTHEWAMAEVAVGHARAGNVLRAAEVLDTLKTATAVAWATGELACDAARRGDADAAEQVQQISSTQLRDRALAQVAQALVQGGHPAAALRTAQQIADPDVRARALIDLALLLPSNAHAALERAAEQIAQLDHDLRAPLVVALAAAYAVVGNLAAAVQAMRMLHDQEARERALSRVATALARHGAHGAAAEIADMLTDHDERDWTLQELARQEGEAGNWRTANKLTAQIDDLDMRGQTEADLAVLRARTDEARVALHQASLVALPSERLRAWCAIVGPLVQQGGRSEAQAVLDHLAHVDERSRYSAALVAALADAGDLEAAQALADSVNRPIDRIRAFVAVARATSHDTRTALQTISRALQEAAVLGRSTVFNCLGSAADVFIAIGSAERLLAAAHALDEVDGWWNG